MIMEIRQFLTPQKGCKIVASAIHPFKKEFDYIGIVIKIDGNIIRFKNQLGEIDSLIWKFKDGINRFIYFGG